MAKVNEIDARIIMEYWETKIFAYRIRDLSGKVFTGFGRLAGIGVDTINNQYTYTIQDIDKNNIYGCSENNLELYDIEMKSSRHPVCCI